ncbi:DUF885 domain-containing protein [Massilia sp. W12]|uniref:DUF885 domain-containing protein n=1 Tax=Massilia sp. W12 TaxID=3126507 RepID=UPI0030D56BA3
MFHPLCAPAASFPLPSWRKLLSATLCALALAAPAQARDAALHQIFDADWAWRLRQDPLLATETGERRYNHLLPDVSPRARQADLAHKRRVLQALQRFDPARLDEQDALSLQLLRRQYQIDLDKAALTPHKIYALTALDGGHYDLLSMIDKMPFENRRDYLNYLARLRAVPQYLRQLQAHLDAAEKSGWRPPRVILSKAPQQLRLLAQTLAHSQFSAPLQNLGHTKADQALRQRFQRALQSDVKPALLAFAAWLQNDYLPRCRETVGAGDLPQGAAYYQLAIRENTTTDMTAEQVHALGLQEVARIQQEMQSVMRETGFNGDFNAFAKKLNTEPQFFHQTPEALLQGHREMVARTRQALPALFGKLPHTPPDVKAAPGPNAEQAAGAWYEAGSPDGKRPGRFYANTSALHTRPKWKMETLTLHEAEPGHHFQVMLAQDNQNLPAFRRFGWLVAYGEGWALYAESLGPQLGWFKDPYARFGHLDDALYRAARLVVDTGLHAKGWSRQQAIDYLNQNTANPPADNEVEVDRYIGWPGQALGYKIGQLKILQMRQQAETALGARFDIRAFHDYLLASGPLPLDILEQRMRNWQQTAAQ